MKRVVMSKCKTVEAWSLDWSLVPYGGAPAFVTALSAIGMQSRPQNEKPIVNLLDYEALAYSDNWGAGGSRRFISFREYQGNVARVLVVGDARYATVEAFKQHLQDENAMLTYETATPRRCLPVTYKAQQLVKNGNFEDTTGWQHASAVTFETVDNEIIVTATQNVSGDSSVIQQYGVVENARNGHKIFIAFTAEVKDGQIPSDFAFAFQGFGSYTTVFAHAPALSKHRYTVYFNANINAGYKNNGYLQVANATAGMKWAFSDAVCVDVTDLYGAGNEPTSVATFLQQHPEYNSYVPFYDGKITQRRIIETKAKSVDLGTLNWQYVTAWEHPAFRVTSAFPQDAKPGFVFKCSNNRYNQVQNTNSWEAIASQNLNIGTINSTIGLVIRDDSYTSASAFKQAMQGVILTYETT